MGSSASVPLTATEIAQEAQNIRTELAKYSEEFATFCSERQWKSLKDIILRPNDEIKQAMAEHNLVIDESSQEELFRYLDSMREKHKGSDASTSQDLSAENSEKSTAEAAEKKEVELEKKDLEQQSETEVASKDSGADVKKSETNETDQTEEDTLSEATKNPPSVKKLCTMDHGSEVWQVAILPDGRVLSCGEGDYAVKLWTGVGEGNPSLQREMKGHTAEVRTVVALPATNQCASGGDDNTIRVWNFESGECIKVFEGHTDYVYKLCPLTNTALASGSYDRTVRVWNSETGDCLHVLEGHKDSIKSVCRLTDSTLASGSWDYTIRVWNFESGECVRELKGHTDGVCSVCLLTESTMASGSWDNTVRVWNFESGECLKVLEGHTEWVYSVCRLTKTTLASGSYDKTIRVYDFESGKCLKVIEGHTEGVIDVCFSPSHGYLCSGSFDKSIIAWK